MLNTNSVIKNTCALAFLISFLFVTLTDLSSAQNLSIGNPFLKIDQVALSPRVGWNIASEDITRLGGGDNLVVKQIHPENGLTYYQLYWDSLAVWLSGTSVKFFEGTRNYCQSITSWEWSTHESRACDAALLEINQQKKQAAQNQRENRQAEEVRTPEALQDEEWKTVTEFVGSGSTNTRAFTISASEWRAVWRCSRKNNYFYSGLFQAQLKKPGKKWTGDVLVNRLLQGENSDSGTSYQYSPGRFYLEIVASNTSWTLAVQVPNN